MTEPSIYDRIGGEPGVRRLVAAFYAEMDTNPHAAGIRAMHHGDLQQIQEKLFEFLSGWFGGPSLYIEKYGHPRMRARHLPFQIGISEMEQWLLCMSVALDETVADGQLRSDLFGAFARFADHMRNVE